MHLTDDSYRGLLSGRLRGAEAAALARHLEAPCDACEGWLEARPPDGLDGRVDAALLSLAPPRAAGGDLAFARIERALRAPPAPRRRRWLPALALAATVAVAGLAALLAPRAPGGPAWDGEKGVAVAVPLRLRFLVLTPAAGGPPALERGLPGQEVPSSASLQFEVELGRPANVLLARAVPAGSPEVFFAAALGPGRHVVTAEGQPAAYPLASLGGPQRFLALASEAPLGPADAARAAARRFEARSGGDQGPPISLDEVEVRVRP